MIAYLLKEIPHEMNILFTFNKIKLLLAKVVGRTVPNFREES